MPVISSRCEAAPTPRPPPGVAGQASVTIVQLRAGRWRWAVQWLGRVSGWSLVLLAREEDRADSAATIAVEGPRDSTTLDREPDRFARLTCKEPHGVLTRVE
jgi:hypothetical protein